ncbi:MAG: metallophosphoesterase family protein [Acidobacteriota bacterium]
MKPTSASLLALLVPASTLALSVTRGPYLQRGTPAALVVRWRTDTASDSRVSYGSSPTNLTVNVDDATVTTEHEILVSGLAAETTYYYTVGSTTQALTPADVNHFFVTQPPVGSTRPFRIWVLGDSGTANANARAVRDAYYTFAGQSRTDFWLMLGDNAYQSGTDAEYQAAVFNMYPTMLENSVIWPTFGNHDGISSNSNTETGPYYDIFTLPRNAEAGGLASGTEAYYSFDYANIHFICMNANDIPRSPSGAMMTWLTQDLAATTQPWVIAFWHQPPYTKGSHDSDTETQLVEMRQNALPILEQGGVDLVLCGHSHDYERTFLIDGHYGTSSTFGPANLKDGGDGNVLGDGPYVKPTFGLSPHEGAVYVVAGSSGQIGGGPLNHPAMYVSLNVLGSVVLDIHGNGLEAKFLDSTGAVRDTYTIYKGTARSEEVMTGAGPSPSNAPVVKVWSHVAPPVPIATWSAYGAPDWGANVASVDMVGGGIVEMVTGPGPGTTYGPQVRGFGYQGQAINKVNFYAYGTLRYGVHPGGGDVDGDGHGEILTAPGPGPVFGPHIRGWNYDGTALTAIGKISFFAYSTLRYGARVTGGGVDADVFSEIVTGAGAGAVFSPHVRGFNYDNSSVGTLFSFFAFTAGQYGADVAAGTTDADPQDEVFASHGPDPLSDTSAKGFDTAPVTNAWTIDAFPGTFGGAEVAAGDVEADGRDELIASPGWGAANPSIVQGYDIVGNGGAAIPTLSFTAYAAQAYGAKVAAVEAGIP